MSSISDSMDAPTTVEPSQQLANIVLEAFQKVLANQFSRLGDLAFDDERSNSESRLNIKCEDKLSGLSQDAHPGSDISQQTVNSSGYIK